MYVADGGGICKIPETQIFAAFYMLMAWLSFSKEELGEFDVLDQADIGKSPTVQNPIYLNK